LCRDGTRRPVDEYRNCNWGQVPSHAVVTTSAQSIDRRRAFQKFLRVSFYFLFYSFDLFLHQNHFREPFNSMEAPQAAFNTTEPVTLRLRDNGSSSTINMVNLQATAATRTSSIRPWSTTVLADPFLVTIGSLIVMDSVDPTIIKTQETGSLTSNFPRVARSSVFSCLHQNMAFDTTFSSRYAN